MKMAKATEKDIDAAGDAMTVLDDISSGYYPKRDGDDCEDFRFDPDDPAHLRKFYDLMRATLDASPGWPGRVIGGMCYVILYPKNEILDPDASTLELHPQWVKRSAAPCASAANSARPMSEWHEDDGPVVWWKFPVGEPAWIGTPNCDDWPGYHTHWTPHPAIPSGVREGGKP